MITLEAQVDRHIKAVKSSGHPSQENIALYNFNLNIYSEQKQVNKQFLNLAFKIVVSLHFYLYFYLASYIYIKTCNLF